MEEEDKEKKLGFLEKLHRDKKKKICFFIITMAVLICLFCVWKPRIYHKSIKQLVIAQDDFSWVYQIEDIKISRGKLILDGWAFMLGKDAEPEIYEIILLEPETGSMYFPSVTYSNREDVNAYFLCENNYTASGFQAAISVKKLNLEESAYEVLLYDKHRKKVYSTGIYCAGGEMMFADPKKFEPLQVAGTDLEEIVNQGKLRVYRPDAGMYVYQYEGSLYWIAEPWYEFANEDAYIQFQMNTTQVENLPQNRLDNGWLWSNLGFLFQKHELKDKITGKYRVAAYTLPTEYSLTKIWTGSHADDFPPGYVDEQNRSGWIWRSDFRPWYEFEKSKE